MANMAKVFWCIVAATLLLMAGATASAAGEEVSCGDAVNALIPCGPFLLGEGPGNPSRECCASAQKLNSMAHTVATRRQLCKCFKEMAPSFGVKPERAVHLPPLCKVKLNFAADPDVNCNTLQ